MLPTMGAASDRQESLARVRAAPAWSLLVGTVLCLTLVDAALLQLRRHYLSGGFLAESRLESASQVAAFLGLAALLDAVLVGSAWLAVAPLLRRLPVSPLQRLAFAAAAGLVPGLVYDVYRYELTRYLGDLASLDLLLTLAGDWPLELLAQGSSHLAPLLGVLAGLGLGLALGIRALGRLAPGPERLRLALPAARALAGACVAAAALGMTGLLALRSADSPIAWGLERKPSGAALLALLEAATDFDRDGAGLLARPADAAPFDAALHPYARDLPGNGIDENGIGGDHPADFALADARREPAPRWPRRPHFVLVYLESFRADLLGARVNGRAVTPVLDALAARGASSQRAYVHAPYTHLSRGQLFAGALDPRAGQATLLDDFRANGYRVAYFSGQDESLAGSEALTGSRRADVFYDARRDIDQRSSRFSTPASLAVSWKRLNARALDMLAQHDFAEPLFLYVNYHDTHFPYHHAELDDLLGVVPLARGDIRPEARDALFATYANAAANVDRAIGELLAAFAARAGPDFALLVTADHGQSLFEHGFLGHGQSLADEQTRVPLVLAGLGGDWPEPVGAADLRALVRRNLPLDPLAQPLHFRADPAHVVLQFTGRAASTRRLGLRTAAQALEYDRVADRLEVRDEPRGTPHVASERDGDFRRLVWAWEELL